MNGVFLKLLLNKVCIFCDTMDIEWIILMLSPSFDVALRSSKREVLTH